MLKVDRSKWIGKQVIDNETKRIYTITAINDGPQGITFDMISDTGTEACCYRRADFTVKRGEK